MKKSILTTALAGICLASIATTASANQRCASHNAVVERLADVYGERRQAMGLAGGNAVIEVYASDESGSWSITITQPGGPTCLVAAGQNFRLVEASLPAEEDPDA